jgi:hypothetical protein
MIVGGAGVGDQVFMLFNSGTILLQQLVVLVLSAVLRCCYQLAAVFVLLCSELSSVTWLHACAVKPVMC